LVAAVDPHDSVGIIDRYFPEASFFTEFERFDRHLENLRRRTNEAVDYLSICSPNHLHDAHIRLALRVGADAICEKPLVLNPWNLDVLEELEQEYERKVFTLLQLRVHPAIMKLKEGFAAEQKQGTAQKRHVDLSYITSRGMWYKYSWKGDHSKSGGIATNIGVHFFDMLMWFFGPVQHKELHLSEEHKMSGFIELEHATVSWYLSLDQNDLPEKARAEGKTTYRSITIDDEEIEFSGGFTDLHTRVYENILAGKGFGIADAREAIKLVHDLRNMKPRKVMGHEHPFLD
jgi:UDP-N-acetyl-2-amino-2-deoxyglucuronate dehydrogenase